MPLSQRRQGDTPMKKRLHRLDRPLMLSGLAGLLLGLSAGRAAEPSDLEFLEAFVWGDRAAALKELVPSTDDYFFFHCLHHQLAGDRVAFQQTLEQWRAANQGQWNARMIELRRRQRLMDFDRDPEELWSFLRSDQNLRFDHRPRHERPAVRHPGVVEQERYSLEAFLTEARRIGLLTSLSPRGLEWVLKPDVTPDDRRAILARLPYPDTPGLVGHILADLDYRDPQGRVVTFGQHPIHRRLTRAQLEDLGRRRPALLGEETYVQERLARLPPPDADLANDHEAAARHFQALWDFAGTLGPMHNSLKASVLYRLLDRRRRLGVYDADLFRAYLALPRPVPYLPRERHDAFQRERAAWVDFRYQPAADVILPPIINEEPLVHEYLIELLKDAPDPSAYAEFIEARWLDAVFAESKILHGVGRPEEWASRLSPGAYRAILERVELNLAPQSPSYVPLGRPVELKADIKRVDEVQLKIFEIQTFNYYTTHRAPLDQAVDLDGLTATHERTIRTAGDPARRVRHTFPLPEITRRGVYVIELIGGGVSSRAVLHVGRLEAVSLPTSAGQAVLVLNDAGETVEHAALWVDGREYNAGEHGIILLPFSEQPGERFVVLRDGDFCSPEQMVHLGEEYAFSAGIHLDPQNLPRRHTAVLILRPDFRIHGIPLDPALLGKVTVSLAAVDAKGVRTVREYEAEFARNAEWTRPFHVPDDVRRFEVRVQAKIRRKTDREEITLVDESAFPVNGARAGDALQQIFLMPAAEGWRLEVRGLAGEPIAGVPLTVLLRRSDVTVPVHVPVSTDDAGRVKLGPLDGVVAVEVAGPDGLRLERKIEGGAAVLPPRLHALRGETISLPYPWDRATGLRPFSLFQVRGETILADLSATVALEKGEIRIADLPAGEYRLHLHEPEAVVPIEVVEGDARAGYLLGRVRRLQQTANRLPSLAAVALEDGAAIVRLRNATPSTRVAVRAHRYLDAGSSFPSGLGFPPPVRRIVFPPYAQYISGRRIGDEYRYVIERRARGLFAGTLLERPGLILNPWEIRETAAEREQLREGEAYRRERQRGAPAGAAGGPPADARRADGRPERKGGEEAPLPPDIGYDFLPQGSRWWTNLKPDADGVVRIPLADLDEQTALDVIILDRFGASRARHAMADRAFDPRDTRLLAGLKSDGAFSRQKNIRVLGAGEAVVFPDLATTRYQTIRTPGQVFDLLQALADDAALADFVFLKDWPELAEAEKLKKYGEHACHELHLFLYERDRDFFDRVVRPYLANKKDKTFVDRWLLGALTPDDTRLDRLQERNALELALLARRGGDAAAIRAMLREAWELLPPDPEGFARRVRASLLAGELDEAQAAARQAAREEAAKASPALGKDALVGGRVTARAEGAAKMALAAAAPAMLRRVAAEAQPRPAEKPKVSFGLAEAADKEMDSGDRAVFDMVVPEEAVPERLYRALPRTKEWAEQNYYRVRAKDDVAARVPVSGFWLDVANGAPVPERLLEAHRNLTEVLAGLAFCGLPWEAEPPEEKQEGAQLTLSVRSPALLVTDRILPARLSKDDRPLLVSQQFFRPDDPYRFEGNERIEKFVTGEFVRRIVYGARVTLTNPTASRRRLNVLRQIPRGAVPLRDGVATDDADVVLDAYTTQTIEYFFTFPFAGEFDQFPPHVAANEEIVGRAEPRVFHVVETPTEVDKTSWTWVSQYATDEETLAFLRTHNLRRLDLDEMAWRLKNRAFFEAAADLLTERGLYHETTFSYAVHHKDAARARVWLSAGRVKDQVGPALDSPLLKVDPVETKVYEHLEYDPLVNPRAHPLGDKRRILNTALNEQYRSFLGVGLYRPELNARDRLALVYYLLLQDRIEEGTAQLAKVREADLEERLQTDYLRAWLALRHLDAARALELARPYLDHPAPRWQARFRALAAAVAEARGAAPAEAAEPDRQQDLDRLAAETPSVELKAEGGSLLLTAHRLKKLTLNLYPMDIELMFSRRPFLTEGGADFAVIKPAFSREIEVRADGEPEKLALPREYADRNLMVEVVGAGRRAAVPWYASRLRVRKMESFGQIEVRTAAEGQPVPKAYVKVFARGTDGHVSFWKDGYTDLRGRFDYLSLNDRRPEEAAEFAILILHPELGAEIRTASPPMR